MLLSLTSGSNVAQLGSTLPSLQHVTACSSQVGVTMGRQLERADTTWMCVCVDKCACVCVGGGDMWRYVQTLELERGVAPA